MTTFISIMIGVAFGLTSVFFYALGLSHGISAKNGSKVKLQPVKAIANAVSDIADAKAEHEQKQEDRKQKSDFYKMLNWNGDKK